MGLSQPEFAIAFDVPDLVAALALDAALGEGPEYAKIGLELFTAEGMLPTLRYRATSTR